MTTNASYDELGPVDHLIVEFRDGRVPASAFTGLMELADQKVICVLDLEFVELSTDGHAKTLDAATVSSEPTLATLAGATSGLLDEEDLQTIAAALTPGSKAAVLIFENLWVNPMISAFRTAGGHIVSENRVPVDDLLIALDRIDPPTSSN